MKKGNSSGTRRAIQVILASGVVAGAAMPATADDFFLSIPGVPGESQDSKHKGEIDVLSFTQVADGKACLFTINKRTDRSSPTLAAAATGRTPFASARLTVRKAGFDQLDYYIVNMQSVAVEGYSQSGAQSSVPVEQVALVPRTVSITYRVQDDKGGLGGEVVSTLNCPK
jgi:type VI secretion system secreted protein Hcp